MSLLFVAIACGDTSTYLEPPPNLDRHRTLIFVLESDFDLTVTVHDLGDPFVVHSESETDRLAGTALLYEASPAQLGLTPGTLGATAPETCGATPLPAADRVYRFDATHEGTNGWEEGAPTEGVSAFRYPGPCACPDFRVAHEYDLEDKNALAIAAVDERRALLFATGGGATHGYWVTTDGATPIDFAFEDAVGAVHSDGDDIWIASGGVLRRGTASGDFVVTATTANGAIVTLDGPADDLFFMTDTGELSHSVDDVAEVWATRTREGSTGQLANVLRLGPGHVASSPPGLLDFEVYRDGVLVDQDSVLADARGLFAMTSLEGFGVFALYESSEVFRYEDATLLSLPSPRLAFPRALVRYAPDVAVYGTVAGETQVFVRDYGFCETRFPAATAPSIQAMVRLGAAVLVIGPPPGSREILRVQVLEPGLPEG